MKRIVGSLAALTLALSLGVAAYGKASPKQNQPNNTKTAPAKTSTKKHSSKKNYRPLTLLQILILLVMTTLSC